MSHLAHGGYRITTAYTFSRTDLYNIIPREMAAYSQYLPLLGSERNIQRLKEKQMKILDLICVENNKEIVGILPTGFGKSIIYQLLPLVLTGKVLVFSPLSSIQEQQVADLSGSALKSCILNTRVSSPVCHDKHNTTPSHTDHLIQDFVTTDDKNSKIR